jgi:hypothetical protein
VKKWARKHDYCIECKTTTIKHHAKGLCKKCSHQKSNHKYRQNHIREEINKKKREYYQINRKSILAKKRQYAEDNKDYLVIQHRKYYYSKPIEERTKYTRKYRDTNRDKINLFRRINRQTKCEKSKRDNLLKSWLGLKVNQNYE